MKCSNPLHSLNNPVTRSRKTLEMRFSHSPLPSFFSCQRTPRTFGIFSILLIFKFIPQYKAELVQAFTKTIVPLFATGKMKTIVDSVFTMDQIQLAHKKMESNQNIGKIVIKIATPQVDENVTKNKSEL